ncbi:MULTISPECIES: RagB/SusD family nutrient uptake outer membrane protein [unclassified Saccharicrinis]|uniref:RagB/SusD family nutrient uptake outer membrane protein n=1 Tax=unclassified Saccharicrinis TaxID=2646859 RepID=UPI003D346083
MKKILYILLVFAWGLSSCEDYLEVEPKNQVVVSTYNDVKATMGSCLAIYTKGNDFGYGQPFYSDPDNYRIFTYYSGVLDDTKYLSNWWGTNHRSTFHSSLQWYNESLHPELWTNLYSGIGFFNNVLYDLGEVDVTEDEANLIKGEAKFLRAWYLYKLMQYFSPYGNNNLGIPVNLNAEDVLSYDASRKTQEEVYAIIISELEEILTYSTEPTSFSLFYDKQMVNALLAQVYWFKGGSGAGMESDYDNAIKYAQTAMLGEELASLSEFGNMFKIDDNGTSKDNSNALLVCTPFGYTHSSLFTEVVCGYAAYGMNNFASERLYSLYSSDDVRNAWVNSIPGDPADFFAPKLGAINKFSNLQGQSFTSFFFFRIADLQLIIAESYARKGDNASAVSELEKFQMNRYNGYVSYTGSDVLQDILDERTKEFCFEYDKVWLDMVRTGKGFTRPAVDLTEEGTTYTLEDNDYRLTQPIPLVAELEENRIEQNPGWNFN